jgi:stage III sporulation protein AG
MMIPSRESASGPKTESESKEVLQNVDLATELSEILSNVQGAGKVKVMLTESEGERTLYQTDTTYSQSDTNTNTKTQTILITDNDRNETGLIHQKNPPIYRGAVVLAQGADEPTVRLAIVDAVSKVTGLGADKISVLKMK